MKKGGKKMIELSAKKKFLSWVIQCVPLKRKEAYWMLNYLLKHESLLQHVMFVEGALNTPRGILITDRKTLGLGLEMKKGSSLIEDPQAIYSELRNHQKDQLFIEINFVDREQSFLYLEILEDNDYRPLTNHEQEIFFDSLDQFLEEEALRLTLKHLEKEIDKALEDNNKEEFLELTDKYTRLKAEKVTSI